MIRRRPRAAGGGPPPDLPPSGGRGATGRTRIRPRCRTGRRIAAAFSPSPLPFSPPPFQGGGREGVRPQAIDERAGSGSSPPARVHAGPACEDGRGGGPGRPALFGGARFRAGAGLRRRRRGSANELGKNVALTLKGGALPFKRRALLSEAVYGRAQRFPIRFGVFRAGYVGDDHGDGAEPDTGGRNEDCGGGWNTHRATRMLPSMRPGRLPRAGRPAQARFRGRGRTARPAALSPLEGGPGG